ncbi:MAG TPA: galactokinase family protein [Acidimicrobiales bacterium]|nr:galactokinase family protein [Acidimicrobiales bacterium]
MPRARAPGRVTIVGDHTDYNGGLSLPMAIDLATEVTFTPKPGSFLVGVDSDQCPDTFEVPVGTTAPVADEARLAAGLLRLQPPTSGGTLRVISTLPVGAGLSSSAAFAVAVLLALGHDDDPLALACACQEAERSAGAHVGLLDPLAIAGCTEGHALAIDFTTLDTHLVPVPSEAAFVIVHSEAPRQLTDTPYSTRRSECERAAHILGRPLGLSTVGDLAELRDPILRRRARHVITECARVREAERLLEGGDLATLGEVMTEGHRSLAHDYRVSVPTVDDLVDELIARPGVLGARMSGGGFGGCVVALCEPDSPALDPEAHAPRRAWRVSPSGGAARLVT